MRLLLVGDDGRGTMLSSLYPALSTAAAVTVVNPAGGIASLSDVRGPQALVRRRLALSTAGDVFVEAVHQHRPDVALIVKGRGLAAKHLAAARVAGVKTAIVYADNPYWRRGDAPDPLARLAAADLVLIWNNRLAHLLKPLVSKVSVLPLGYDHRWFQMRATGGSRRGIVFLGTWSPRRERFLRSLQGLPLTVHGTLWEEQSQLPAGPPVYEAEAGNLLGSAVIGVNLLHPQCAGAHNMRTREIAACGALQLTDPGEDATPLRPGISCEWFRSPGELRALAEHYLSDDVSSTALANEAQRLIGDDTYDHRAREITSSLQGLMENST